jgi:HAD superfamily hydrolase (TIGR01549 family)
MDYIEGKEGISRVEKIHYAHKEFLGIDLGEQALSDLAIQFTNLVEDGVVACPWVPGAEDLLEETIGNVPVFVVTGTPEDEILRIVERRNMGRYFTVVRGSPPRKPPIVRELLANHGLLAERCLFVGDALFDFETAQETGLNFIGRLLNHSPDPFPAGTTTVKDLHELRQFLQAPRAPVSEVG